MDVERTRASHCVLVIVDECRNLYQLRVSIRPWWAKIYVETYSVSNGWEFGPEVGAAILQTVVLYDVLDDRVADVADDEHGELRGAGDAAEIVGEGKHRPAVGDSAELGVRSVGELAIVD